MLRCQLCHFSCSSEGHVVELPRASVLFAKEESLACSTGHRIRSQSGVSGNGQSCCLVAFLLLAFRAQCRGRQTPKDGWAVYRTVSGAGSRRRKEAALGRLRFSKFTQSRKKRSEGPTLAPPLEAEPPPGAEAALRAHSDDSGFSPAATARAQRTGGGLRTECQPHSCLDLG